MRKFSLCFILSVALYIVPAFTVYANSEDELRGALIAPAAILMDAESGRVLFGENIHQPMYPASMTKILTSLIVLEHFEPHEMLTVGTEIMAVPGDASRARHFRGESLTVANVVRGLMIPSGNDTANVAARSVVRRAQPNAEMTFQQVERYFAGLMNARAEELGAQGSNFANASGYHHPDHHSTAYDIALITREAMRNPFFARIAREWEFAGYGAGEDADEALQTQFYQWRSHNALIAPEGPFFYPYAIGVKTGFTTPAGHCLAAAATRDGVTLIAVVFDSPMPGRWHDTVALFEYGFTIFDHRTVQTPHVIDTLPVLEVRLGEDDMLDVEVTGEFQFFMSEAEQSRIQRQLIYDTATLTAPVEAGATLGTVRYTLDGDVIFTDTLIAARDMEARTFWLDATYYRDRVIGAAFSAAAIPYWIGGALLALLLLVMMIRLRNKRKRRGRKRRRSPYKSYRKR